MVDIVNYSNWLTFARKPVSTNDYSRIMIFVNIRLSSFHFSFHKDIIDHRDIILASLFINSELFWIMNVYSDSSHSAIKYLKNTKVNIHNLLIMIGDFDIRDSLWDLSYSHYSFTSDDLIVIVDSFNLSLSVPTNQIPTRYSDKVSDANSVIDLIFLCYGSTKLNQYLIHPDW